MNIRKIRLGLLGMLGAGVLLAGIGAGIAFGEYSSLEYTGEHSVGEEQMEVQKGEISLEKLSEEVCIANGYVSEKIVLNTDASLPKEKLQYEVLYNAAQVSGIEVTDRVEDGYIDFYPQWQQRNSDFAMFMEVKDELLKDLKQSKIGDYTVKDVEKITLTVNPEMREKILVD